MTVHGATHFYKYKAPPDNLEWLRDTIVRHQLYFPLPRELNDPAEARPLLEISADASEHFLYRQWCKENPSASKRDAEEALEDIREGIALMGPDKFYGRMIDGLHDKYARRRIFSLSKRWDTVVAGMAVFAAVAPLSLGVVAVSIGVVAEFAAANRQAELRDAFVETKEVVTAVHDPVGRADEWILDHMHQNTALNREAVERAKDMVVDPPKPNDSKVQRPTGSSAPAWAH